MRRSFVVALSAALVFSAFVVGSALAFGSTPGNPGSGSSQVAPSHVASAFGRAVVSGQEVFVHVTVAGVSHADAAASARAELGRRGAVPVQSAEYSKNGTWKQFSDSNLNNDQVGLYWSSHGGGTNYLLAGGGLGVAAQEWNDVSTSAFMFSHAGDTSDCPSLVDECAGDQVFNGRNEAGWADLGGVVNGGVTLGVTWFNFRTRGGPFAAPQEADMVLNSHPDVIWGGTGFEMFTVAAHELGHVAGLGHSSDTDALMYAWYQDAGTDLLDADDIAGISALYPASDGGGGDTGSLPGYCKKHPERAGC